MRRIAVITTSRADYGIYRPLLATLRRRRDLEVGLVVTGSHLEARHGATVGTIESDGQPVWARFPCFSPGPSDGPAAARAMGEVSRGMGDSWAALAADMVVVLGDRFEMHAAAAACLPFGVPICHLHGGEVTEGAIDECYRHAITKLSHLHFVATPDYGRRVRQLGEEAFRVHVTGAPALDAIIAAREAGLEPLESVGGIPCTAPFAIATYHPETTGAEASCSGIDAILSALDGKSLTVIFTAPNADPGSDGVRSAIEAFVQDRPNRAALVPNLGIPRYYQVLAQASVMIGNSSSGIIEAGSFGLPVVNVGDRQRGRTRGAQVIDVPADPEAVRGALDRALAAEFRASLTAADNPYGDGHACERIAEVLATVPIDRRLLVKRFIDLPEICP